MVLEVSLLTTSISVVLGVPMNSKSSTFNVYHATPLYQPNDDLTASLYQLAKTFLPISTDNPQFAELGASTLQQCSGNTRIKLCRKGFSTTSDDTIVYLHFFITMMSHLIVTVKWNLFFYRMLRKLFT